MGTTQRDSSPRVWRSAEDTSIDNLHHAALVQALDRLPCRMRQVTWLWALGTPTTRIAQQMRITPSTVRVHLHQARQRLATDPLLTTLNSTP